MYSIHNEGKSLVAERFTRTLIELEHLQIHDLGVEKCIYR